MARIILIIAAGIVLWYLWQQAKDLNKKPPKERRAGQWRLGFIVLFGVTLLLVVSGRAHWLAAAVAAALPLLKGLAALAVRSMPLLQLWQRHSNSQFGPRFKTAYLEVKINLRNGQIDGTVLQGEFAGQTLSALDQDQLNKLLEELRGVDREGTLLLNAYLARRFTGTQGQQQYQQQQQSASGVSTDEAWQILGLEPGADEEEIIRAHKKLIQKLHPDRGGNDYLAAKINAAKDVLLKGK
jgi:hypothetical protein